METLNAPGHNYPEVYRCDIENIPIQSNEELQVGSWLVAFTDEFTQLTLESVDGWLTAILWNGSATIAGTDLVSCRPDFGHIGMLALEPGSLIQGEPGTRLILAGLIRPGGEPKFDGSVVPGIAHELDSTSYTTLTAMLRAIKTHRLKASVPDGWWRTALVVTSAVGPGILPREAPRKLVEGLTFAAVRRNDMLNFTPNTSENPDAVGDPQYQIAVVLDFHCPDDPSTEPGCTWRCWGGGGL